ncbi:cyclin-dependent kinase inhibitor 7-like [Lotus japonicus]|uniref:cyclin-dependent kinase inhibitor 7-like n=1 Tax=Lotus japonicus TaxID=34305 RepID=UPI00258C156F|nr:cyclin-dependent kinase inhibitor 7-like [Lotus japonicus]
MSDCKRSASTIAAMEEDYVSSSSGPTISKKRKTTPSNSHCFLIEFPHISPETSLNSAGTVVSGESCLDRSPLSSCCSSSHVADTGESVKTAPLDLEVQTKGFETVDSTNHNLKSFSLLREFSGDSEELVFPEKYSAAVSELRKMKKTPPMAEIEEFFATTERNEQKRFAEKYNFDIVRDMPLEGRYQWVRLH